MSQREVWYSDNQPHTIFHWEELLSAWNDTYMPSHPINCVLENWRNSRARGLTAYQFKKYLNGVEEQDGMKWFLYECVMDRQDWTWLEFCSFIRSLTDDIELDTTFPVFPGSPRGTVRDFLYTHLSESEIDILNLMPPLISADRAGESMTQDKYATIEILIIRDKNGSSKERPDDSIKIKKEEDGMYSMKYVDNTAKDNKKSTVNKLTSTDMLERLSQMFRLMTVDSLPFEAIQLFIPNYPTVFIKVDKLDSSTRTLIYDTVESTMKNWPVWS